MAFLGPESRLAAEASECAGEQGRFWEYRDRLFAEQGPRDRGAFGEENLKRYAREAGLDAARFGSCLDGGRYGDLVRAETESGRAKGVRSTPSLFVNGAKVEMPTDFDQLSALIDAELREVGR